MHSITPKPLDGSERSSKEKREKSPRLGHINRPPPVLTKSSKDLRVLFLSFWPVPLDKRLALFAQPLHSETFTLHHRYAAPLSFAFVGQ